MKGEQMVARYMLGEVAEQGQAESPGSDGASPYLSPQLPPTRRYADTPIRSANPLHCFGRRGRQLFCFRDRGINIAGCTQGRLNKDIHHVGDADKPQDTAQRFAL